VKRKGGKSSSQKGKKGKACDCGGGGKAERVDGVSVEKNNSPVSTAIEEKNLLYREGIGEAETLCKDLSPQEDQEQDVA